jgi:hypothetical protein
MHEESKITNDAKVGRRQHSGGTEIKNSSLGLKSWRGRYWALMDLGEMVMSPLIKNQGLKARGWTFLVWTGVYGIKELSINGLCLRNSLISSLCSLSSFLYALVPFCSSYEVSGESGGRNSSGTAVSRRRRRRRRRNIPLLYFFLLFLFIYPSSTLFST